MRLAMKVTCMQKLLGRVYAVSSVTSLDKFESVSDFYSYLRCCYYMQVLEFYQTSKLTSKFKVTNSLSERPFQILGTSCAVLMMMKCLGLWWWNVYDDDEMFTMMHCRRALDASCIHTCVIHTYMHMHTYMHIWSRHTYIHTHLVTYRMVATDPGDPEDTVMMLRDVTPATFRKAYAGFFTFRFVCLYLYVYMDTNTHMYRNIDVDIEKEKVKGKNRNVCTCVCIYVYICT